MNPDKSIKTLINSSFFLTLDQKMKLNKLNDSGTPEERIKLKDLLVRLQEDFQGIVEADQFDSKVKSLLKRQKMKLKADVEFAEKNEADDILDAHLNTT